MKILKTKTVETITEELTITDGTYYFSYGYTQEEPYEYYKVEVETSFWDNTLTAVSTTKIVNDGEDFLISHKVSDDLDLKVKWYFIEEWNQIEEEIKEITCEEFEKQKSNVLELIKNM